MSDNDIKDTYFNITNGERIDKVSNISNFFLNIKKEKLQNSY